MQPNTSMNLSPTKDAGDVQLVVDLSVFGDDAIVYSQAEAEVGEFDEDSDGRSSDDDDSSESDPVNDM